MLISGGLNSRGLPMPPDTYSFVPPFSYSPLSYFGKNLRSGDSTPPTKGSPHHAAVDVSGQHHICTPSRHSCPAAGDYVPATPCSPVVCPEPVSGLPPYRAASAGIRGSRPDRSHTPVRLPPDTAGNSRTFPAEPFHFAAGDSLPAPPLPRTPAAPPAASPVRDFPCRDRWGLFSKVPAKNDEIL